MTNLKQLKDFLGQHGLEVDIVDLSQPHINVDDKSGVNNTNLQEVFIDLIKELGLETIKDNSLNNNKVKMKENKTEHENNVEKEQNTINNEKKVNFKTEKCLEKSQIAQDKNLLHTINHNIHVPSKLQDIDFKMRELKRKIAIEESSANLIQLTLDLAALAEEKQKEEGSLELRKFQQNITQAMQELDSMNNEMATLSNMFKAWNENESNGIKEMHGMKEMLEMQVNKLQNYFTQLKQLTK